MADMNVVALDGKAREIRKDILKMITAAGSGHPGGSLSAADIVTALYFGGIMQGVGHPIQDVRDRFILAKGHAAPVLYAALAHADYFPRTELDSLRKLGSRLQGHPDPNLLPGVEVSTGSLGQGLSIAAGLACGLRLAGDASVVFTLLGDGECQEGQVWEAAMFAAHQKIGRLIAIIDHNGLQIDGRTADVCNPEDLGHKFAAFGWRVSEVDGHNISDLVDALAQAKAATADVGVPQLIVAHTIKGKGVSFMEDKAGWHGKAPSTDELAAALAELETV